MRHWAYDYIGLPYADGKNGLAFDGPDSFNCWGWVRFVFRTVKQIEMPVVHIDRYEADFLANRTAIRKVFEQSGWRPVADKKPQEFDISLMSNAYGRHVGIASVANGVMSLVHAIEGEGVSIIPFNDLWMLGYSGITNWRLTS